MAKVTLRERAERWAAPLGMDFNPNAIGQRCMRQGFTAGWHARGRADRVTKALVEAVQRDRALLEFHKADGIIEALNQYERAKVRK